MPSTQIGAMEAPSRPPSTEGRVSRLRRFSAGPFVGLLAVVVVYGVLVGNFAGVALQPVAVVAVIYALFATSVGMTMGWAGVPTFGQAIFFGTGAFTAGLLRTHTLDSVVIMLLAFVIGAGGGVVLFFIGARRSAGLSFAMVTLAIGQVLEVLASQVSAFGGENGLTGIPRSKVFGLETTSYSAMLVYVLVVFGVLMAGLLILYRSRLGAAVRACRDDPLRAAASGLNVQLLKGTSFALSAGVAAVAGVLFAQDDMYVSSSVFDYSLSGMAIIMMVVGGMYSFWGPTVGAVLYTYLQWKLSSVSNSWFIYLGLAVIVIVLLRPEGLVSLKTYGRAGLVWLRERLGRTEGSAR
jgi:branched-chain amino acid transport system permease protein